MIDVQPDNPWGLRNKAILSLGYDLLARRSEITALRTGDVTWRPDGTLEVIVRRSKADPFRMGRLAYWRAFDDNYAFSATEMTHQQSVSNLGTNTAKQRILAHFYSAVDAVLNPARKHPRSE
ncbi:MAG: hypothetical protein IKE14_01505 [Loktanella sp.]|nr:hypothetical protein [Loktanella sp.]